MYRNVLSGGVLVLALVACGGDQDTAPAGQPAEPAGQPGITGAPAADVRNGRAVFRNAQGTEIGTATLTQESDGVRVDVSLTSLQAGEHGFHFHAVGACDPPSFDSAGPHFNPTDRAHGFNHPDGHHLGDLRNLEVGTDGTVRANFVAEGLTLAPGQPNSLFDDDGTALVVHAGADDYESQPSGDSGARIACAVVEQA
jgi:superoxide dismutase, Cu-Zn family